MRHTKKKIVLVYPNIIPAKPIQIGISSLSAVLKSKGHEVSLFDTTFMFKTLEYHTQEEYDSIIADLKAKAQSYDIIAISCRTSEWEFVKKILGSLNHPHIIIGGPHASVAPEECLKYCDNVCIGEAEDAIVEFVENPERKDIQNIWSKEQRNPLRPLVKNLDILQGPDWSIWDDRHLYDSYAAKKGNVRVGPYELSRGCPFSCTYCINKHMQSLYKGQQYHREKSIKKAIKEMKLLKDRYRLEVFYIIDETFLLNADRVREFSKAYKKEIGIPFNIMTRPEVVTEEKFKLIKDAGCNVLSIGIEQGNEAYRKKHLNRHMTNRQIEDAFSLCRKLGIRTMSFNMVGLPYESRELVFDTINLNRKVKPDIIQISIFFPFPGTELRTLCEKENFINRDILLASYYRETVLNLPQLSSAEIVGFKKTFKLYCKAPTFLFPIIRLLEKDTKMRNLICEGLYLYMHHGFFNLIKRAPRFLWKRYVT